MWCGTALCTRRKMHFDMCAQPSRREQIQRDAYQPVESAPLAVGDRPRGTVPAYLFAAIKGRRAEVPQAWKAEATASASGPFSAVQSAGTGSRRISGGPLGICSPLRPDRILMTLLMALGLPFGGGASSPRRRRSSSAPARNRRDHIRRHHGDLEGLLERCARPRRSRARP